jgi:hypothetical protein
LIIKVHVDVPKRTIFNGNLKLLYDLELILGLHGILSLLDYVDTTLIKLTQSYVCDFIDAMNVYLHAFYHLYFGPWIKFDHLIYDKLNTLETIIGNNLNDEIVCIYIN